MHEATIASNILDILLQRLANCPNTAAVSITVLVGEFRNVDDESLCFAFDAIKDSIAGCCQCQLNIEKSQLLAKCSKNGHIYEPNPNGLYRCECGSPMGEIIKGQELDVVGCTLRALREDPVCMK